MKKRLLSILLTVVMVLSLMPMTVMAETAVTVKVAGVTLTEAAPYWRNGDTSVSTGTESDYNVYYDADSGVLTLKDAVVSGGGSIDGDVDAGIYVSEGLTIRLVGSSTVEGGSTKAKSYGIYAKEGKLTIQGNGSLSAIGGGGDTTGMNCSVYGEGGIELGSSDDENADTPKLVAVGGKSTISCSFGIGTGEGYKFKYNSGLLVARGNNFPFIYDPEFAEGLVEGQDYKITYSTGDDNPYYYVISPMEPKPTSDPEASAEYKPVYYVQWGNLNSSTDISEAEGYISLTDEDKDGNETKETLTLNNVVILGEESADPALTLPKDGTLKSEGFNVVLGGNTGEEVNYTVSGEGDLKLVSDSPSEGNLIVINGLSGGESYAIYGETVSVTNCRLTAVARNTCDSSYGIYSTDGMFFTGSDVTAVAGAVDMNSRGSESSGVYCDWILNIKNTELTAFGGSGVNSYGIGGYNILIEGGAVTALGGNAKLNYGDVASCGITFVNLLVKGGAVNAIGSDGYNSYGLCGNDVSVSGGNIYAAGGAAVSRSAGLYGSSNVLITNGKVSAIGGTGYYSHGICGSGIISLEGGNVQGIAGTVNPDSEDGYAGADSISAGIFTSGGPSDSANKILINGADVYAKGGASGNAEAQVSSFGLKSASFSIEDGSLEAIGGSALASCGIFTYDAALKGGQLKAAASPDGQHSYGICSNGGPTAITGGSGTASGNIQAFYTAPELGNSIISEGTYDQEIMNWSTKSSGSSGGHSGGSSAATTTIQLQTSTTDEKTNVSAQVKPVTNGKTSTATVDSSTIDKLVQEAAKVGTGTGDAANAGITIEVSAPASSTQVNTVLPAVGLASIAKLNLDAVNIATPIGNISFDNMALAALGAQIKGTDITVSVTQLDNSKLSQEQQAAVGDRPVIDFSIMAGDTAISSFNGGKVKLSVPYTLKQGEKAEGVFAAYVSENGTLEKCEGRYNPQTKSIEFETSHFSKYVIGYDENAAWVNPFTDVKDSAWYYGNVAYVVGNGIMNGTTADTFLPKAGTNRAMIVTMLYRMAGSPAVEAVSAETEKQGGVQTAQQANVQGFADVKSGKYYTDAVSWAASTGTLNGMGENAAGEKLFAPNANISRQDLAVLLFRYAAPEAVTLEENLGHFTDSDKIASYAVTAVNWSVGNGILSGKTEDTLDPRGIATRAEVAAMIERFNEKFGK